MLKCLFKYLLSKNVGQVHRKMGFVTGFYFLFRQQSSFGKWKHRRRSRSWDRRNRRKFELKSGKDLKKKCRTLSRLSVNSKVPLSLFKFSLHDVPKIRPKPDYHYNQNFHCIEYFPNVYMLSYHFRYLEDNQRSSFGPLICRT